MRVTLAERRDRIDAGLLTQMRDEWESGCSLAIG
jgi:hypothetical protein